MNLHCKLILLASFLLSQHFLFAQYILNGSAQKNSCNCYTLTQPQQFQTGSVWNTSKISLANSFDFSFNVYLGCNDNGADGMAFILQPVSTSVGVAGGGMGFEGLTPSIGIALDTYQNVILNDPAYDHISIQANGIVSHAGDLAGPVSISSQNNNVEDCQWHKLRISWDAGAKWLRAYFDGILRVEKQVDLVSTIFNNDPAVYWGFTGATGSLFNLQQFCTALDPIFTTNFANNIGCEGEEVVFANASESFAPISAYNWSFGDGSFSTAQNPPPHSYISAGTYQVNLKITGLDGCERDSTKTITIAAEPIAGLSVFDTCLGKLPRMTFQANNSHVTKQWLLDGVSVNGSQPDFTQLAPGLHQVQLAVVSDFGCGVPAVANAEFLIKPNPTIKLLSSDGCINDSVLFQGIQTDMETTIDEWTWRIDGNILNGQTLQQQFQQPGNYPAALLATATNGCSSDTFKKVIKIVKAVIATNDTTIIRDRPVQLFASGNGTITWAPSTGLSNPAIATPIATLQDNQNYTITVTTPEGCISEKNIEIKVFNGPTVYLPTGFTPNGDGKNEILLPVYVGIKELKEFAVFNRWGQKVFATKNMNLGWEGKSMTGTYVWLIQATDFLGKPISLKGTITLIR